ncbi:hypothetical protein ORG41_04365 [[Curtobacterium] plantarum]|uniref:hypothetical protein n=1 Tax=Pantoea TaxID=53335 RepID=UPI0013BECFF3|nr:MULTISPECIES: hypothetical protein [Pantoea]MCX2905207.1 hypothetical protein [[Curtobacterium] plantarum]NEH20744.1 hypothetical protein [Pantoea agglomerans]
MASTDDVASYLAGRVSDAVYPGGSGLPGIINAAVKIYPGWPAPGTLQQDINSGGVHVSIWPLPAERKISTALGRPFRVMAKDKPALQFIVNGSVIDVSGVADALTSVRVSLKGKTFTFTFRAGTTADQAVTALGAALPESFTVLSSVFIPLADHISVSATTAGTAVKELHRQIKDFQITVWAPAPGLRDRIGSAIDTALSEQCHIDLNDGAPAQLLYARQFDSDRSQNWHVYRRDLIFSVNYATTRTITAPEVTQFEVTLNGHQTTR